MSPLDGTFPLVQVNTVSMLVRQHLNFYMAGLSNKLLHKDSVVTKTRLRLATRTLEAFTTAGFIHGDPHALATTPCACLKHHRVTDHSSVLQCVINICQRLIVTRYNRQSCAKRQFARGDLVPHDLDSMNTRANKGDARLIKRRDKTCVLRQESVAWMDGIDLQLNTGSHYPIDIEITLCARRRTNTDGFVR